MLEQILELGLKCLVSNLHSQCHIQVQLVFWRWMWLLTPFFALQLSRCNCSTLHSKRQKKMLSLLKMEVKTSISSVGRNESFIIHEDNLVISHLSNRSWKMSSYRFYSPNSERIENRDQNRHLQKFTRS